MKIKLLDGRFEELTPDNIESAEVQQALTALRIVGCRKENGIGFSLAEMVDYEAERAADLIASFVELQLRLNGGDASKLSPPPAFLTLREIHIKRSTQQAEPKQEARNDTPEFSGLQGLKGAFAKHKCGLF